MAGAPEGNQNAAKAKQFYHGLRRALARSGGTVDGGLNKICDELVMAAIKGDQWAIKEVADRMDGKPPQAHTIGNDESGSFRTVNVVELVPLASDDGESPDTE